MEEKIRVPVKIAYRKNPDTGEMEEVSKEYVEVSKEVLELYWKGVIAGLETVQRDENEKGRTFGEWLGI